MKEVNGYYKGFRGNDNRLDYLKYGLLNEFGFDFDSSVKEGYNEDKIIKTQSDHRKTR